MNKFDLEERMIEFAVLIIENSDAIIKSRAGNYLASQLVRSGTSPALNYGEAQSAESRKDFIHKLKIALKELRETMVCLKIILKAKLYKNENLMLKTLKENDELISILVKSVKTANKNTVNINQININ